MKEVESLWEEVRELSLGNSTQVERLELPPSPVQFLRDFVSPNKPCIISNALLHWPAFALWSCNDYLGRALASTEVSVHLTPNGRADSLAPHPTELSSFCFASAHVQQMPFTDVLHLISNPERNKDLVAYAQQQNDCFHAEYAALASDCEAHIDWATEALGCFPEAVNLWIGNHLSETSFHKDHYENLYAVVSGEKHFLLLPPTDVHRLYIREYPAAKYSYFQDTGEFDLKLEDPIRYVPWCSVNPFPSLRTEGKEMNDFPLYFNGPMPFECTVKTGEILYLRGQIEDLQGIGQHEKILTVDLHNNNWWRPSMWFHYVRQTPGPSGCTIAINYWYDMQFDVKYAYFNFLQSIRLPPRGQGACLTDLSSGASVCTPQRDAMHIDENVIEGSCNAEEE